MQALEAIAERERMRTICSEGFPYKDPSVGSINDTRIGSQQLAFVDSGYGIAVSESDRA
jgi:hypothetical protein